MMFELNSRPVVLPSRLHKTALFTLFEPWFVFVLPVRTDFGDASFLLCTHFRGFCKFDLANLTQV